jgi:hypothetical protein
LPVISVLSLNCPVCGAPFSPGSDRCGYCGSILVLQTDHPRIDPRALNRTVVDKHIAEYRELLRTDPSSVKAHYGLGVAYFNLGLTEASITALETASNLTPENPHIHTQLAVAWREEAKTGNARANDEMRDHIRYALRLDPRNVEALILASEAAIADHDIEQAVSYSEQAWSLEPDRARDLHERMLRMWYGWKRQRGGLTPSDLERVRRFSPAMADEMNDSFRLTATPFAAPMIDPDVAPRIGKAVPVVRSVLLAFLAGIGLFVVLCGILLTVFDTESGTSSSAFLGLVLLALMSLPFILATRAWYKVRKKDQSS